MVSQNPEQRNSTTINNEAAPSNRYSYTQYDGLSRITTVGELYGNSLVGVPNNSYVQEADLSMFMSGTTKKSITRTFYDSELSISSHISYTNLTGKLHHLRKRVVATTFQEDENSAIQQASYYSYDLMGNVKSIWQQVYGLQDLKQISYQYELSSGKTTGVLYQDGKTDAFYHQYEYDGENRIKAVYTNTQKSTDANLLSIVNIPGTKKDASYQYYLHGPLSRTELGGNLQGLDYSYTLQGWLKSLNGQDLNPLREMGRDGESGSGLHSGFSRDVLAYSLGYFIGDYQPINNSNVIRTYTHFGVNGLRGKPVFNGNISFTTVANKGLGDESTLNAYIYAYYQNGNLSGRSLKVIPAGTNSWNDNIGSTPKYYETLAYDLNGNIISHIRAGNLPADSYKMDELLYDYTYNSNRLDRVRENYLNAGAYTNDIEGQSVGNYTYDKIGNLISDVQEGITGIFWNVYGKIREIRKGSTVIKYRYDAAGNRVYKEEVGPGVNNATWYVRDAQGNTLATYEGVATPTIKESYIYGSSRLGSYSWNIGVGTPARTYEISNYLGNVMATIGDGQIPRMNGSLIEYYDADIKTATDYYSYGMVMPGRSFNSGTYRYGFNGQEMSNEIKGVGNSYTAEFWEYDPRLGRRWNLDPKPIVGLSQYSAFANNPILFSDPLGDTLSNPQLRDALKIASSEIKDALKNKRSFFGPGTNSRMMEAIWQYHEKNNLSTEDFAEMTQAVDGYYNGLATIAMVSQSAYDKLDRSVINASGLNSKQALSVSVGLMREYERDLAARMQLSLGAASFVATAGVFPNVGSGPKVPFVYSANELGGLRFTNTTMSRILNPSRAISTSEIKKAIKTTPYPDPQGSGANAYYMPILRNGNQYNLKVVYSTENNTVYHFHFSRSAMGPLPKIKK